MLDNRNQIKAVIFARISSREQENGFSIDAQVEKIRKYCVGKDLNVIKEFIIVESSTRGERKKFHEMLTFVKKTTGKVVIVADCVDRLQRSFDQHKTLSDLCKSDKIEIHFVRDGQVISKDANSSQKLFWNMSVAMAQSYTDCSSDNIKRSIRYRKNKGEWSNLAPVGYLNAKDINNKSTLLLDEERAPLIKYLFEEYATGTHTTQSLSYLAKQIKFYSRAKRGKSIISRAAIYRMLNNPFYYGVMKNADGQYIKHKYETIISKETFARVQKILRNDDNVDKPRIARAYGDLAFAFKSLVVCKTCGCTITSEQHTNKSGKQYTYLRCSHIKGHCNQKIVNENVLFKQLNEEVFEKIKISSSLSKMIKANIKDHYKSQNRFNSSIKKKLTDEIKSLEQKRSKLIDLILEGGSNLSLYENKLSETTLQLEEVKEDILKYKEISEDFANTMIGVVDIMSNAKNKMKTLNSIERRELLGLLFEECYLDGKKLIYTIKKPFSELITTEKGEDWLNPNLISQVDLAIIANDIERVREKIIK